MRREVVLLLSLLALVNGRLTEDDLQVPAESEDGGKLWALLVAGSDGFFNYRHQADICHAYQIMKAHGIPDERIIIFMKDDIAYNDLNVNQGVLINRPNGPNVYPNVPHDYTGKNYTLTNFFKVLAGESTDGGSGKTLKTGPNDNIFFFYADHGGPGISGFGSVGPYMKATLLNKAIKKMYDEKRYNKMAIYWESCESGSMFAKLLKDDINVFVATAANPTESSYACYPDAKDHDTYLGDVFSVRWMEDTDRIGDLSKETMETQWERVKKETNTSHVQHYGDLSFTKLSLSTFMGTKTAPKMHFPTKSCGIFTAQQDVPLMTLLNMAKAANSIEESEKFLRAARELQEERDFMLKTTMDILKPFPEDWITTNHTHTNEMTVDQMNQCYYPLVDAFDAKCYKISCNNYAFRVVRYFTDLCIHDVNVVQALDSIGNVCDQQIHDTKCGIE